MLGARARWNHHFWRAAAVLAVTATGSVAPAGATPMQEAPAGEVRSAQSATFTDPASDTFSAFSGTPLEECRTDILSHGVTAAESSITFSLTTRCGSNPHTSPHWAANPSFGTEVAWLVDADGIAGPNYYDSVDHEVTLGHRDGALRVDVWRYNGGWLCGGTVGWDGDRTYSATISPGCIGSPGTFRMLSQMLWDDNPFGSTHLSPMDQAPNLGVLTPPITRDISVGDGPGVASENLGEMDVFVRGQNDRLYTQHHNGSSWSGYLDLGGIITSTPAANFPSPGQVDVYVRGQDNALYARHRDGATWSDWVGLGGILTTAPAVTSDSLDSTHLFVAGFDRALYTRHRAGTSWGGWENLGGIITATPAAASRADGTVDVFARGQDNALWTRSFNGTTWGPWTSLGGIITTAPAAASPDTGTLVVFARGTDNALWTNRFNGTTWSGWISLGGVIASPPAATSPMPGTLDVFVRGQDAGLYWNHTGNLTTWDGWTGLGGIIK